MPVDIFYNQIVKSLNPSEENFSWIPPDHPALAPFDPLLFPWQAAKSWSRWTLPPISNTGGKLSSRMYGDYVEVVQGPDNKAKVIFHPLPEGHVPKAARVDWLGSSFQASIFGAGDHEVLGKFSELLYRAISMVVDLDVVKGGKNFYKRSYDVRLPYGGQSHDRLGFVAIGGNRDTVFFCLTGTGCSLIDGEGFLRLRNLLEAMGAKLTRVDLAYDDFEGVRSVDWVMQEWLKGDGFKCWGKVPSMCQHGNWERPDGSGRTIEVGKRDSSKMLRAYEKGKQLGDPNSTWVRFEVEFKGSDRVLPYEMLTDPGSFLAGAYPCLAWVSGEQSSIKMVKKAVKVAYGHMKKHARIQVGKFINFMQRGLGLTDAEIIKELLVPGGVPRRLLIPMPSG